MEIWKPIKGLETKYEISNKGNVRSLDRLVNNQYNSYYKKGKILKPYLTSKGYLTVELDKKNIKVHRLVAEMFIPNPYNKEEVNHINGIKTDNILSNIEWNTSKENIQHSLKNKLRNNNIKGEKSHLSKLTEIEVLEIRNSNLPNIELSMLYNVESSTIRRIKNRVIWKHI